LKLRRRFVIITLAVLLILGGVFFAFYSPSPALKNVRSQAFQVINRTTVGRPAPPTRALASVPTSESDEEEPAAFDCLSYLRAQVEDYDLFLRRLDRRFGNQVGSWYFYHDEDLGQVEETSAAGLFLLGLANAGLLEGNHSEPNLPRAMELLNRARELDPKNSAPLVYLAYLADQRGDATTAEDLRSQIASTTHFNSYILSLSRAVHGSIESPSDYINVIQVWSSASIPNYEVLRKSLRDEKLTRVAEQMVAAQNFKGEQDLDYFLVEGAIAVSVLKKLHPERSDSLPSIQNVIHRLKHENSDFNFWQIAEKDCELSKLEPVIKRLSERLAQRPAAN
jgi:hypothetical protein